MRILFVLLLLSWPLAAAIYRWVDEQGVVHYSDLPPPGQAEAIAIKPGSRVALRPPRTTAPTDPDGDEPLPGYTLAILAPAHDGTVRSNDGRVTVRVASDPKPAAGHSLQLLLDGQPLPVSGGRLQLENLDRGSHRLQALMVDGDGALLAESPPVTFHLHRQSRLFGKPRHQTPSH